MRALISALVLLVAVPAAAVEPMEDWKTVTTSCQRDKEAWLRANGRKLTNVTETEQAVAGRVQWDSGSIANIIASETVNPETNETAFCVTMSQWLGRAVPAIAPEGTR